MWFDLGESYVNENSVTIVEIISEAKGEIIIHTQDNREVRIKGLLGKNILRYLRDNRILLYDRMG